MIMKTISRYLYLVLAGTFALSAFGQEGKIKSVENDYSDFAYVKTSEVLLEVANKGYKSADVFQKLANSYYFNNDMKNASKWYGELMTLNEEVIDPEIYFRYALALKGIENYEESDKRMAQFNALSPEDLRGKAFLSKVDYKSNIEQLSRDDIEIHNLEINTELSDFGTTEYENGIVFASARGGGRKYQWNEEPFLDLYSVEKTDNGYGEVKEIEGKVNTKYHESSAVFSPNGKYMFFTRNNYFKSKYKKDDIGINRLQLYRATLGEDGVWGDIHKIHFNSEAYSVAHPALNLTGSKLYFASDMPGTYGQSDIFVVDVKEDGTLGFPKNLGTAINTEGQESFPFINTNGTLYYSSTGFPGLGGLDVYKSEELNQKVESGSNKNFIVENAGKPINSPFDDFGYYENVVTKRVYFSSNREGGKGSDDIYTFELPEPPVCEQLVAGTVQDKKTEALIANATVILFDNQGNELERKIVGTDAAFEFALECEKEYLVRAEKQTYSSDEKRFTTPNKKQDLQLQLVLEKDEIEIEPCDDLAKILNIPIIYFDFDKFDIRYDAEIELQKVLSVLNKYPTMKIDIRSHTDCRATYAYNERLSENRAQSTRQYLIDKGISSDRLTAKGYGESRLVNDCGCEPTNESSCSEEEHQLNRRSEFIVTSIDGKTCDDKQ